MCSSISQPGPAALNQSGITTSICLMCRSRDACAAGSSRTVNATTAFSGSSSTVSAASSTSLTRRRCSTVRLRASTFICLCRVNGLHIGVVPVGELASAHTGALREDVGQVHGGQHAHGSQCDHSEHAADEEHKAGHCSAPTATRRIFRKSRELRLVRFRETRTPTRRASFKSNRVGTRISHTPARDAPAKPVVRRRYPRARASTAPLTGNVNLPTGWSTGSLRFAFTFGEFPLTFSTLFDIPFRRKSDCTWGHWYGVW